MREVADNPSSKTYLKKKKKLLYTIKKSQTSKTPKKYEFTVLLTQFLLLQIPWKSLSFCVSSALQVYPYYYASLISTFGDLVELFSFPLYPVASLQLPDPLSQAISSGW